MVTGPCRCCPTSLRQWSTGPLRRVGSPGLPQAAPALDFGNAIVLFGSSLLLSVLPFIILLSSLANHRIDTDLSRHIGLNREGARIISELFRSSPAHSAAPIVTALILAAVGTLAVAGSLQVIYERVFGQPHRGWRDVPRFAVVLGAVAGATWDRRKGRPGGIRTGSSGRRDDGSRPPEPASRELTP